MQLEREVHSLRTMLDEQDKVVAKLKKDLHQLQSETEFRAKKFIQTKFEELMAEAASPITQIHTQAHLVEEKNRNLVCGVSGGTKGSDNETSIDAYQYVRCNFHTPGLYDNHGPGYGLHGRGRGRSGRSAAAAFRPAE